MMKKRTERIRQARGLEPADLVLKNAKIVNVFSKRVVEGDIALCDDTIVGVGDYTGKEEIDLEGKTVIPGLIDAHIHIESTLATPEVLAPLLLSRGTTMIIADPHEIVNAAGMDGLRFMIEQARDCPIDIRIMMPSSVPSCDFETNGAGKLTARDMKPWLEGGQVFGLGEVMRLPDVLNSDAGMMDILDQFDGHPIDGHAPGLRGKELQAYRAAGIVNDHEAVTAKEAIERIESGFHLFLREGSGAHNLQDLLGGLLDAGIPLDRCSICTDDRHLDDILEEGHIDYGIRKAIEIGASPIDAIRMGTINTAMHYGFRDRGAIAPGYKADLVVVDDLDHLQIEAVFKDGQLVYRKDVGFLPVKPEKETGRKTTRSKTEEKEAQTEKERREAPLRHSVRREPVSAEDFTISDAKQHIIELIPGQLLTKDCLEKPDPACGHLPNQHYNLLAVCERYGKSGSIQTCLLKGYNLKNGALASTNSHDSHNIIAAGDNADDLALAINTLIEMEGGYVLVSNGEAVASLPLKIGGLMSSDPAEEIIENSQKLQKAAHEMGIALDVDPFINLSFLALPVIPSLRLTDRGLYDVTNHRFIEESAPEAKQAGEKETAETAETDEKPAPENSPV